VLLLLSMSIITAFISFGVIIVLGAFLNSVFPERWWGQRTPITFLRYLFWGFVVWGGSLMLVCIVPFFNERVNNFIKFLEIEAVVGGKLYAYTFVVTILSFFITASIWIVNGIWRDFRERRREEERQALMERRQEEIEKII